MLCLEDCMDFCELEDQEIEAIAEHEHIPTICAAEMGCTLLKTREGVFQLHTMVLEDMRNALDHGQTERAGHWASVYLRLQTSHPLV